MKGVNVVSAGRYWIVAFESKESVGGEKCGRWTLFVNALQSKPVDQLSKSSCPRQFTKLLFHSPLPEE